MFGCLMRDLLRTKVLHGLTVIQFAMPKAVSAGPLGLGATTFPSFRANASFAKILNYGHNIKALPDFLRVLREGCKAFFADHFAPPMSAENPDGQDNIVPGAAHFDSVIPSETLEAKKA